jgi:hypothetical protein
MSLNGPVSHVLSYDTIDMNMIDYPNSKSLYFFGHNADQDKSINFISVQQQK